MDVGCLTTGWMGGCRLPDDWWMSVRDNWLDEWMSVPDDFLDEWMSVRDDWLDEWMSVGS